MLRCGGGANPVRLQAHVGVAQAGTGARPWKIYAGFHHGVGLLLVFAMAHHLGRKFAGRNYLVHAAIEWRMGIRWPLPGSVPFCNTVHNADFASVQTRYHTPGLARRVDPADAFRRSVL